MLQIEDLSSLTELATQDSLVLDIFSFMWTNSSMLINEVDAVRKSIDKYIPILLTIFKDTDAVTLVNFVGKLIPKIPSEVCFFLFHFNARLKYSRLSLQNRNGYPP
jgi:hypothetical protein